MYIMTPSLKNPAYTTDMCKVIFMFLDGRHLKDFMFHQPRFVQNFFFKQKSIFLSYNYLLFKSYFKDEYFIPLSLVLPCMISISSILKSFKAPLLFILHTSNQSTTNHTINGDFADNKTILALSP